MHKRKPTYTPPKRNSRAKRKEETAKRMRLLGLNQPRKPAKKPKAKGLRHTPRAPKRKKGGFVVMPRRRREISEEEARRQEEKRRQNIEMGRRGGKHGAARREASPGHSRDR